MDREIENIKKIVVREMINSANRHYSISYLVRMEACAQGLKLTEKQIQDLAKKIIFGD